MKGLYVLKEKRIYKRELPLWGSLLACLLYTSDAADD